MEISFILRRQPSQFVKPSNFALSLGTEPEISVEDVKAILPKLSEDLTDAGQFSYVALCALGLLELYGDNQTDKYVTVVYRKGGVRSI